MKVFPFLLTFCNLRLKSWSPLSITSTPLATFLWKYYFYFLSLWMTPSFTPPPSPLLQPLPHTSLTAVWQQFTCSFPKLNTNKTEMIFWRRKLLVLSPMSMAPLPSTSNAILSIGLKATSLMFLCVWILLQVLAYSTWKDQTHQCFKNRNAVGTKQWSNRVAEKSFRCVFHCE